MKSKKYIFILLLALLIGTIGAVSAVCDDNAMSEIDQSDVISVVNDESEIGVDYSDSVSISNDDVISDDVNSTGSQNNTSETTSNSTQNTTATSTGNTTQNTTATSTGNTTQTTPKSTLSPIKQFEADLKDKSKTTITLTGNIKITKQYKLTRNLVINGNGYSIDAQSKCRIFETSYTLTVKNLIFKNGKADKGGAIKTNKKLVVEKCTFTSNKATANAGAIYITGGSLTITDSTFNKNQVKGSKTGYGGAIWIYQATSSIKNTKFTSNSVVCKKSFTHSQATKYHFNGGAIYYSSGKTHSLSKCTFTSNYAANHGGSMFAYANAGTLSISASTFSKNNAKLEDGGAVSFAGKKMTVSGCTFKNNKAYEDGGAIDSFSLNKKAVTVSVKNTLFDSNTAEKSAGAIWMGLKTKYTITNCNFTNNKGTMCGAVYNEDGSAKITNCIFDNNKAAKITKRTVTTKSGAKLNHCGGAVTIEKGSITLSKCSFTKNTAVYGGAIFLKSGKLSMSDCTLPSNKASKYCSGLYAAKSVTISNKNKWGAKKVNTKKAIKSKLISSCVKAK